MAWMGQGLLIWALLGIAAPAAAETLYISAVEKGSVNEFLQRWATPEYHVVVTKAPVEKASRVLTVDVPKDRALYMRELYDLHTPRIPGELGRFGRMTFFVAEKGIDAHGHEEERIFDHIEVVPTEVNKALSRGAATRLESNPERISLAVDAAFLQDRLEKLAGAKPITVDGNTFTIKERGGATGRDQTRTFLAAEYRALGFQVSEHDYGRGKNVVAEKAGTDPSKVLLLTSHFDSVNNAGADDNAAGTITALAVAHALKDMPLKHSLRIVAFDQEELGLVGSEAYVRSLKEADALKDIIGVLNLEMTAYDSDGDGAFHVIDCKENTSAALTTEVMSAVAREGLNLHQEEACTNRSDHAPFWRQNVPAVVISQNFFNGDPNPCYHRSCDKMDKVNISYMKDITTALANATAAILATP